MNYKALSLSLKCLLLQSIAGELAGLPNYGLVNKNLSRSAQPNKTGFTHLDQVGVDTILKLNRDEEFSVAKERKLFDGKVINNPLQAREVTVEDGLKAAAIIDKEIKKGNKVHVHCVLGRDRTGLAIAAWKLIYGGASLDDLKRDWKTYGRPYDNIIKALQDIANQSL